MTPLCGCFLPAAPCMTIVFGPDSILIEHLLAFLLMLSQQSAGTIFYFSVL